MFAFLSSAAQTQYAQLLDTARSVEMQRSTASLNGRFQKRQRKGRSYWYFVYYDGKTRNLYVGPDNERVRALVATAEEDPAGETDLSTLVRSYVAAGGIAFDRQHLSVIRRMAERGFFHAGGVLVGTHAFRAYANMLGVRWSAPDTTQDVDLSWPGRNVSVALPPEPDLDLHDALISFEQGFIPGSSGELMGPSYRYATDAAFQVDFLTTLDRSGPSPRSIPELRIVAQPLAYMDFLLEDPQQAVLVRGSGAWALVQVPEPARFAVHKLILSQVRPAAQRAKRAKDLAQAGALIAFLQEDDPTALKSAMAAARARGKGWSDKLDAGFARLD